MIKGVRHTFGELQHKVGYFVKQNKEVPSELMSDYKIAKIREQAQENVQSYLSHVNKDGFYRA